MIEPLKPERVLVTRGTTRQTGQTSHRLHLNSYDQDRQVIPGRPGAFLGVGILLDSGHQVYALPDQIAPLEAAEDLEIAGREAEAQAVIDSFRRSLLAA